MICSHFGFFAPGQVEAVQSLQETQLYQEDFIGDSSHVSQNSLRNIHHIALGKGSKKKIEKKTNKC